MMFWKFITTSPPSCQRSGQAPGPRVGSGLHNRISSLAVSRCLHYETGTTKSAVHVDSGVGAADRVDCHGHLAKSKACLCLPGWTDHAMHLMKLPTIDPCNMGVPGVPVG